MLKAFLTSSPGVPSAPTSKAVGEYAATCGLGDGPGVSDVESRGRA